MAIEEVLDSPLPSVHGTSLDKTKQRSTAYSNPPTPTNSFSNTRATVDPSGDVGTSTHQVFHI